jgi:peroxiredoxin
MEQALIISAVLAWVVILFNLMLTLALVRRVNSGAGARTTPSRGEGGLNAGELAPNFLAQTLDGREVSLTTYAGRSVAFVFVDPGCGPCIESLPQYESVRPKANKAGVEFVLVSTGLMEETRAFVDQYRIQSPVLVAPHRANPFHEDYKMRGTPSYTLVDKEGKVQSAGHPNFQMGNWKKLVTEWESAAEVAGGKADTRKETLAGALPGGRG